MKHLFSKLAILILTISLLSGCSAIDSGSSTVAQSYDSAGLDVNSLFSAQSNSLNDTVSSSEGDRTDSAEQSTDSAEQSTDSLNESTDTGNDNKALDDTVEHKLITTMEMRVQTKEFDSFTDKLITEISALGGYIENSSVTYNSYDYYQVQSSGEEYIPTDRAAHYILRIPENKLNGFVKKLYGGTNVLSENRSVEDVTLDYVDLSAHKEALETEAESLKNLMEQATELEDIMQIQTQLTDVRYQIDSIESQLRVYDNKVAYSTLNLDVEEVTVYSVRDDAGYFEKIGAGFKGTINDIWETIKGIIATVLINSPNIILILIIACGGLLLFKRASKNNTSTNNDKSADNEHKENKESTEEN